MQIYERLVQRAMHPLPPEKDIELIGALTKEELRRAAHNGTSSHRACLPPDEYRGEGRIPTVTFTYEMMKPVVDWR